MKKILSLVLAAGLLFLFGCAKSGPTTNVDTTISTTTGENVSERQIYENKINGFAIQFPGTRTFKEEVFGAPVMFFTPFASPEDKLQENVSVTKETLSKEFTLDDIRQIKKDRQQSSGFVEVSNENIKINDIDAKKVIYKISQGSIIVQFEEIFFIKNKTAYTITYTATEGTFNDFAQKVDEMATTLEIK